MSYVSWTILSDGYERRLDQVSWHILVATPDNTYPFPQQIPSYPTFGSTGRWNNCAHGLALKGRVKWTFNQAEAEAEAEAEGEGECSKNCEVCEKLPIKWVDIRSW